MQNLPPANGPKYDIYYTIQHLKSKFLCFLQRISYIQSLGYLPHHLPINRGQGIQAVTLYVHIRMHILVHGNIHVRVPQQLADTLNICPAADTVCGKGMTQDMKMGFFDTGLTQVGPELVLVGPRIRGGT